MGFRSYIREFFGAVLELARPSEAWYNCHITTWPFFRGRRQGRQPLNPGAGPAPVSSPEAFGGNRRLYTLAAPAGDPPPTYLLLTSARFRFTPGSPPVHDYRRNLQCILLLVFKNHRFLQGFGPLGGAELRLGDVKKCGFFPQFLLYGAEKIGDVFNINGANIGPT